MVNDDGCAIGQARWVRGEALAASVFLEVAVIVGMPLWPLITPAVLPQQFVFTPVPPYYRVSHSSPAEAGHTTPRSRKTPNVYLQPASIPLHVTRVAEARPPSAPGIGDPLLGQSSTGPGIAGIDDSRGTTIVAPLTPGSRPPMVSRGVMDASLIHRVQPEYPATAKLIRLSGTVQLRAIIGTDGRVRELEIVGGNPILAQAAVAAVRQWRYQPTQLSGMPVEVQTQITVTFVLE
jgi:protein TonB